jgi:hypothetical protein
VNLRKDHCRYRNGRPANPLKQRGRRAGRPQGPSPASPRRRSAPGAPARAVGRTTKPGARRAKENQTEEPAPSRPVRGARGRRRRLLSKHERLSATDISALASMKNVAKCDTWCELQNPVNHRVFERKLRPKPLGRGHVCLGVTHRVAPKPRAPRRGRGRRGRTLASRDPPRSRLAQNRVPGDGRRDKWWRITPSRPVAPHAVAVGRSRDPEAPKTRGATTATPGQAGLPAEFKHINKRRKRN